MILHISNWRFRGGGTAVARALAQAEGNRSRLLFLEDESTDDGLSQCDEREYQCAAWDFRASRRLASRLLAEHGKLLVHSHGRRPGLHARGLRMWLGRRARIVHSFHGLASFRFTKRWLSAASESLLSTITDVVVAASPAELALFHRLPLACPAQLVLPAYTPRNIARVTPRPVRRIGFAARLVPPKLPADLIAVVAAFNRTASHPLELILAGDGPDKENIQRLGGRLLGDRLTMLGHVKDMAVFHASIDIFALFSRFEGMPVALIDAMACGLPCVASDVIGCNNLIRNNENGLLVAVGDIQAGVTALERLVSDDRLRIRIGEAARATAVTRHDPSTFVAEYHRAYQTAGYSL